MTKNMARVLALVCTVGTLFLVFQVRFVKPEEAPHRILFSIPGQTEVGSSAAADLQAQLEEMYGEPHEDQQIGTVQHLGQQVPVMETRTYGFDFLGRSFSGERYLYCTVKTVRTVSGEEPIRAEYLVSCMAQNPEGTEEVQILWNTLEEKWKPTQEGFASLAQDVQ